MSRVPRGSGDEPTGSPPPPLPVLIYCSYIAHIQRQTRADEVMFSGARADSTRNVMEIREEAALRKQRRIKQGVQFLHKDSAELLPLNGLKKLGTSKEGQPHNILQRRLLEANLSRNRLNSLTVKPPYKSIVQNCAVNSKAQDTDDDLCQVVCQCFGQEVAVTLDTCCAKNLISSLSVEKLGAKEKIIAGKPEDEVGPLLHSLPAVGHIELNLVIGQLKADLSFSVVGKISMTRIRTDIQLWTIKTCH
uniref:Aspartic peptidase DDI1-type domain-containing protein n=1 Tax=Electrophorus electricus TaxID=8005 RepID=A0A4W4F8G6_ELEEL